MEKWLPEKFGSAQLAGPEPLSSYAESRMAVPALTLTLHKSQNFGFKVRTLECSIFTCGWKNSFTQWWKDNEHKLKREGIMVKIGKELRQFLLLKDFPQRRCPGSFRDMLQATITCEIHSPKHAVAKFHHWAAIGFRQLLRFEKIQLGVPFDVISERQWGPVLVK